MSKFTFPSTTYNQILRDKRLPKTILLGEGLSKRLEPKLSQFKLLFEQKGVIRNQKCSHSVDMVVHASDEILKHSRHLSTDSDYGNMKANALASFLSPFSAVYTLNRDPTLIWANAVRLGLGNGHCKDGFRADGLFEPSDTDIHFLNGCVIFHNYNGSTEKKLYKNANKIVPASQESIKQGTVPCALFDSDHEGKERIIARSDYLTHAHDSFSRITDSLFLYECLSEELDDYTVRAIAKNVNLQRLCVGYGKGELEKGGVLLQRISAARDEVALQKLESYLIDMEGVDPWSFGFSGINTRRQRRQTSQIVASRSKQPSGRRTREHINVR